MPREPGYGVRRKEITLAVHTSSPDGFRRRLGQLVFNHDGLNAAFPLVDSPIASLAPSRPLRALHLSLALA
jgi:hypothetical protein